MVRSGAFLKTSFRDLRNRPTFRRTHLIYKYSYRRIDILASNLIDRGTSPRSSSIHNHTLAVRLATQRHNEGKTALNIDVALITAPSICDSYRFIQRYTNYKQNKHTPFPLTLCMHVIIDQLAALWSDAIGRFICLNPIKTLGVLLCLI